MDPILFRYQRASWLVVLRATCRRWDRSEQDALHELVQPEYDRRYKPSIRRLATGVLMCFQDHTLSQPTQMSQGSVNLTIAVDIVSHRAIGNGNYVPQNVR